MSTTRKIYSLIYNLDRRMKGKKVPNVDKVVHPIQYERQPQFIKDRCISVAKYMNSGHFKYNDVKLFLLYSNLFGEPITFKTLNVKAIFESMKMFTKEKYAEDKKFILSLSKKQGICDVREYFDVGLNGLSFIDDFIINKYVSPIFYVKMRKYITFSIDGEKDEHRERRMILEQMMEALEIPIEVKKVL